MMKPMADAPSTGSRRCDTSSSSPSGRRQSAAPGRDLWWHELRKRSRHAAITERTDAEDPLMIIYTSGTTGRPKGASTRTAAFRSRPRRTWPTGSTCTHADTLHWVTDMGWMMGPWEVFGTTASRRDHALLRRRARLPGSGSPLVAGRAPPVTILGVSPTLVRALMRHGDGAGRAVTISRRCAFSAPPASRGIPNPGAGCSKRSASGACQSSIIRAAPRFPAASSWATS